MIALHGPPRRLLARSLTGTVVLGLALTACSSGEPSAAPTAPSSADVPLSADSSADSSTTDSRDLPAPSTTTSPVPAGTVDPAAACVQSAVSAMTRPEQAGQLVMSGTPLSDADSVVAVMKRNHLGSVFLHGRSGRSAAGLKKEIGRLPSMTAGDATIEPLVSIDQEGGKVQSLRGNGWGYFPDAAQQGAWSAARLKTETETWVKALARAGITMDLAPVADTVPDGTERRNPPIGVFGRQYGNDTAAVSEAVAAVTTVMRSAGVIATVKHFPGLGRVTANTDTTRRVTDRTTTRDDAYLRPFQAGIEAGAGAVMMSSATYTKIDPDNRAVFSPTIITDLLREQMGYRGVVMTDDVGAARAVSDVTPGQRAVRFVAAGGDLVLTVPSDQARAMTTALSSKARTDEVFAGKVEAAVTRVLTLKQENGLLTCE